MFSSFRNPRLVLIGSQGDVGQKKITPAIESLLRDGSVSDCLFVDLKSADEVVHEDQRHRYLQTKGVSGIVMELANKRFLGPDVTVLVATPTWHHVEYAVELHDHVGCIGIEKPIAWNAGEAKLLAKLQRVYPIEHQVYKGDSIELSRQSSARNIRWSTIRQVRFCLHETGGVGNRGIDNIVADTGYHGFAVLLSAMSQCHANIKVSPSISLISTYKDGPDSPQECTAAFMSGVVTADENVRFPYTISVGKGLAESRKGLTLFRESGELKRVNLEEGGYAPHKRVIESMLYGRPPLLSVADSINIVQVCEETRLEAKVMDPYTFGSTPDWLTPAPFRNG